MFKPKKRKTTTNKKTTTTKKTTSKKTTAKKTTTTKKTVAPKVVKPTVKPSVKPTVKPTVKPSVKPTVKTAEQLRNEEMAEELMIVVDSLALEVEDLDITVKDDAVTVKGVAATRAEKEKVILALGNTVGVATVDDQMEVAVKARNVSEPTDSIFYTVKSGDSLSKIAKLHYGNSGKYQVIFEANQPMLETPDKIYPGQTLRIPPLEDA